MALPVWLAKGAFASGTAALTVAWPTAGTYAVGDFALLLVESANQAIATPSGWTQAANSPQSTGTAAAAGGVRLAVFYKFATSTSEASVSVADSGDHTTAQIHVFRAVDPTTPIDVTAGAVLATAGASITCPAVTTTVADCLVVLCIANDRDAASTANLSAWTNANLSGLTEQHDQTVTSGVGGGVGLAVGGKAAAGSTGTTAVTNAAAVTAAMLTIALRPEASWLPAYISTETIALPLSATPGAQNITIPADAELVAVHWRNYAAAGCNLSSLASTGTGSFTITQDTGLERTGVAYALVTGTGAKTITPTWSAAPEEGPLFFVSYIKSVNTAGPVRAAGASATETSGSAASIALNTRVNDLVLALDSQFDSGSAIPANPAGWTSRATQGNAQEGGRLRTLDAPSNSSSTAAGNTTNTSGIAALVIEGSSTSPLQASGGASASGTATGTLSNNDLAGQASGGAQASGSATLSEQIALAAVGVSTAGGSANAGVSVPLSAAGIAVAGGSANRTATVTVGAAGLAQAAGQAGLSVGVLLAAAGAAAATGNATLAGQIALAAAGGAQAAGNAALAAQLAAIAAGAAQAGGSATLSGGPAGGISATGGATAGGSATLVAQLAGIAAGMAQASGSANLKAQLAALAAGSSIAGGSAALVALFAAVATGAAQASGSANLSGGAAGQISASGGAQAAGSAILNVSVVLAAAGAGQASGSAQRVATVALTAAGFVQAIGSGQFSVTVPLAAGGQAQASGTAAGQVQAQAHAFWLAGGTTKVGRHVTGQRRALNLAADDSPLPTTRASAGRATGLGCAVARNLTLRTEVLHVQ